jgi:hypothetical protein
MYFPKFWARGEHAGQFSWRWSDKSFAEAQTLAEAAAQQLADRVRHGDIPQRHHGYYPGRPFREQVLRELRSANGDLAGVITRNSYGCLVLNTARIMFVDVDLPEVKPAGGFFRRLFGLPDPQPRDDALKNIIAGVDRWTQRNPEWGWRVYCTRAGLRLLATHALLDPETPISENVFSALGADPLYRQLCRTQKCFRARLTPKPWRCGLSAKPERWPWINPKAEKRFQSWDSRYQNTSRNWATCKLVGTLGNKSIHPEIQPILQLHDETTRAESKLPLA